MPMTLNTLKRVKIWLFEIIFPFELVQFFVYRSICHNSFYYKTREQKKTDSVFMEYWKSCPVSLIWETQRDEADKFIYF